MGGNPYRPPGAPGDHGWGRTSAGTGSGGIRTEIKTQNPFSNDRSVPSDSAVQRGDSFTCHHRCQGARRAGLSGARRRRPRPRAANGRPSPRLSPRAAPPAAPGSASPATTAGPGGDGGTPGAAAPGWGGAPLGLLTRGTDGWPPSSSAGSRSAPRSLSPPHPRGLLAVSSDVSLPPTQCRLGNVVPGCEVLRSSQATQPRGLRPYLLLRRRHQRFPQTCRSPARFGVDDN